MRSSTGWSLIITIFSGSFVFDPMIALEGVEAEGGPDQDCAILLFTTDSEAVRRIHQVCCRLDDRAARRRRA